MIKYKIKEPHTDKYEVLKSIYQIVEKYGSIKGVTAYNLAYHFSRCKKKEVYIKGLYIEKIVIN